MSLMSRTTGKPISDFDHLRQSITDILTTPIGSRVMNRDYGSKLFELIDRPMNNSLVLQVYGYAAEALTRWEPRLLLTRVTASLDDISTGVLALSVEGKYLLNNKVIRLEGLIVQLR